MGTLNAHINADTARRQFWQPVYDVTIRPVTLLSPLLSSLVSRSVGATFTCEAFRVPFSNLLESVQLVKATRWPLIHSFA